jgi:hypothetical protein
MRDLQSVNEYDITQGKEFHMNLGTKKQLLFTILIGI